MRRIALVLVISSVTLAGCGQGGEPKRVEAGLAAYRAGDRSAMQAVIAGGDADVSKPCSAQAFAAARRQSTAILLGRLDSSPLFSMTEDARYIFLVEHDPRHNSVRLPAPEECGDAFLLQVQDVVERMGMVGVFARTARDWRGDLETRYGPAEIDQRLEVAAQALRLNRVD